MIIKFTDGMEFDTSGPLRITRRKDGLYVVGEGTLTPVASMDEAREMVAAYTLRGEKPSNG
jgi:hypothetical protein